MCKIVSEFVKPLRVQTSLIIIIVAEWTRTAASLPESPTTTSSPAVIDVGLMIG